MNVSLYRLQVELDRLVPRFNQFSNSRKPISTNFRCHFKARRFSSPKHGTFLPVLFRFGPCYNWRALWWPAWRFEYDSIAPVLGQRYSCAFCYRPNLSCHSFGSRICVRLFCFLIGPPYRFWGLDDISDFWPNFDRPSFASWPGLHRESPLTALAPRLVPSL